MENVIHQFIPIDANVIGSADDCIYFLPEFFGKKYYRLVELVPPSEKPGERTYIIDLAYGTQQNAGTIRQGVVDAERQKIKEYVERNKDVLEKIAEYSSGGTTLTIWKGTAP